ncbi:hypothetical protein [Spirochaeta dissipatitropha]
MSGDISQHEAILRRLRKLLEQQRSRFQDYLDVLDSQYEHLEADSLEGLESRLSLETEILEQLIETQKTIAPLEQMYRRQPGAGQLPSDILNMQQNLTGLRERIARRTEQNHVKLVEKAELLGKKITDLRIPKRYTSPYAGQSSAQMLDIHG